VPPAIAIPVALAAASIGGSIISSNATKSANAQAQANAIANAKAAYAQAQKNLSKWETSNPSPVSNLSITPPSAYPSTVSNATTPVNASSILAPMMAGGARTTAPTPPTTGPVSPTTPAAGTTTPGATPLVGPIAAAKTPTPAGASPTQLTPQQLIIARILAMAKQQGAGAAPTAV
jgi:type II secretory pathway pseudopilin PulG